MVHGRPHAEKKDDDDVENSETVCHYTKGAWNTPRAPGEFLARDIGERVCRTGIELDVATYTAPKKKHSEHEIGAEEADNGERDDVVESRGGTKHDKGENTGHHRSREDRENRN